MDNFVDERDYKLLDGEKYTFAILRMIMGKPCQLLLTDHERLILCKNVEAFPAWAWTPDGASPEEMERAYTLASAHSLIREGEHFYLKYDLAAYWIARAAEDGLRITVSSNNNAYDCPRPIPPAAAADGDLRKCTEGDLDELAAFLNRFHIEARLDRQDMDACREEAERLIKAGKTYFWNNGQGQNVGCCSYGVDGELAPISNVFISPEFRRRHYAENLVYQVTAIAADAGLTPMLYADADYEASNGCYKKIGYVLRGKLCTVEISRT